MKIFITGATGFIGYYIAQKLVEEGHTLKVLYRSENYGYYRLKAFSHSIQFIQGDLSDYDTLLVACKDTDLIIHAAAIVAIGNQSKEEINKINVLGTTHIVNAGLDQHVPRIIYISSIAAIGGSEYQVSIDEDTLWDPKAHHNAYAISKKDAELEIWRGNIEGMVATVLQPSVVIGAWDTDHHAMQLVQSVKKGVPIYPTGQTGWVDVRDMAEAVISVIQKNITEEKMIINGHNISFKEMMQLVANYSQSKMPTHTLPRKISLFCASVIQVASRVLGIKNNITTDAIRAVYARHNYNNAKSKNLVGIQYRPIEESIRFALSNEIS